MKNYLEYKGYIGTVALSAEDECFFGKIQGINDLVTFEGKSIVELTSAFHESVDEYLSFCEENSLQPQKEYKGQFNVRVEPRIHKSLVAEAAKKNTSLNQVVEEALMEYLADK